MTIPKTLPAPNKPAHLSHQIQWLAGEGAGSWFLIVLEKNQYKITRYAAEGNLECEGFFSIENDGIFDFNQEYSFTYISHCKKVTIVQNNIVIIFVKN